MHAQVFYNNSDVKQVDVPSFSGHFGILPSHVPLIAVLKPGVVTVHEQDGSNKRYFGTYLPDCYSSSPVWISNKHEHILAQFWHIVRPSA